MSAQPTLLEREQAQAQEPNGLAPTTAPPDLVLMFERLATNKDVDVEKLERLIQMQERILAHNAEAAFNAAFAQMQPEIPTIIEKASTDKTKYAPLEDIIEPIRPILSKHGFSLSFRTEWPSEKTVKVIGILTHRDGHARQSEFVAGADQTGSKNAIQALGSSVSYGRRYTTRDLLCIVTREDDDGESSEKSRQPESPSGYEDWLTDMMLTADNGIKALEDAWAESKKEFKFYTARHRHSEWEGLKAKARKVRNG